MWQRVTPNHVTITRIALIPVLVPLLLARDDYEWGGWVALGLFALLSATDGLDGYLARSRNKVTRLGVFLDPLADKLLVTAALITLVQLDEIKAWVVVLILSREFAVTGLRAIAASDGVVLAASWFGKLKTTVQIALVAALIVPDTPDWLGTWLTVLAVIVTVGSGAEYFWNARHMLREHGPDRVIPEDAPSV
jgi:CDP-diacylglycerol--glycerol-3-phosphate 3-phosphatidyltransferase